MDVSLSELQELVMDREVWRAVIHEFAKSQTRLSNWTELNWYWIWGFPGSSAGKEYACNEKDPGSIPGLGRSSGEGIGYSLQYSWASLVAQMVKNPPAMWEIWVQSMGWEDPPWRAWQPTPFSCLENSMGRGAWWATVHGITKSWTRLSN